MNNMHRFEDRLRKQTFRAAPPEWREEILEAAQAYSSAAPPKQSWLSTLNRQLSTVLWPSPKAWLGLAAVWVAIIAIQIPVHNGPKQLAGRVRAEPAELRMALQQQQQLMTELLGPAERPQADRPKTILSRPRSEIRSEWWQA